MPSGGQTCTSIMLLEALPCPLLVGVVREGG